MNNVLNIGLAALILGLAVWAIVAREAYAAVVGFIAYGLLLTLVWVQLHGIDVALTEAAIGGGLTGALLIGAASRLRGSDAANHAGQRGAAVGAAHAGDQRVGGNVRPAGERADLDEAAGIEQARDARARV